MQEFNIFQLNQYQAPREMNTKRELPSDQQSNCQNGRKKVKIPSKWGQILLLIAFFCFINRLAINFVVAEPLRRPSRQAMPLITKTEPITQSLKPTKTITQPLNEQNAGEKFSIKLPGGVLTADGVYAIGIIGVAAAALYISEQIARVACLVVRRLNNGNADRHEFEMIAK
jgi:hypothetical protein